MRPAVHICIGLAIGLAITWVSCGATLATRTERPVEHSVTDEFGETVTQVEWKPTFQLGLDLAGPAMAGLVGLAGVLMIRERRRVRRAE